MQRPLGAQQTLDEVLRVDDVSASLSTVAASEPLDHQISGSFMSAADETEHRTSDGAEENGGRSMDSDGSRGLHFRSTLQAGEEGEEGTEGEHYDEHPSPLPLDPSQLHLDRAASDPGLLAPRGGLTKCSSFEEEDSNITGLGWPAHPSPANGHANHRASFANRPAQSMDSTQAPPAQLRGSSLRVGLTMGWRGSNRPVSVMRGGNGSEKKRQLWTISNALMRGSGGKVTAKASPASINENLDHVESEAAPNVAEAHL